MREIGGYIEFEHYNGSMFHDGAVALNCGRSALAYLWETKKIQKLYLPYFLCDSSLFADNTTHISAGNPKLKCKSIAFEDAYHRNFVGVIHQAFGDVCQKLGKICVSHYYKTPAFLRRARTVSVG